MWLLTVPMLLAGNLYVVRLQDGSAMLTDSPRSGQDWDLWWANVDPTTNLPDLSRIKNLDAYDTLFVQAGRDSGVPAELLKAVCVAESHMDPRAVSRVGAQGLMQLMPATADHLGVDDPFDPDQAIEGGATYLARQISDFGSYRLALAAYNAGPSAVQAAGGIPAIRETQVYVDRVMAIYNYFRDNRPLTSRILR